MDDLQRKAQIKQTFNTVAEGYGTTGMEFFYNAAAHLPQIFQLRGDEHLLDVATGTGIAAAALAPILPRGKITGIDLSEGMLAQARARAENLGCENIELHCMDMQHIDFDNAYFDAANCSFGLFFLPDMLSLLQHIASKVKAGGQVVACSFIKARSNRILIFFWSAFSATALPRPLSPGKTSAPKSNSTPSSQAQAWAM